MTSRCEPLVSFGFIEVYNLQNSVCHQRARIAPADVVRLFDLIDDEEAPIGLRQVILISDAYRRGHQRDGVGSLARARWGSNDKLLGFLIIRHIGEGTHACLKDAPTDFRVDPGGELTGLVADAFNFGDPFGVSGSQGFFTGERFRFCIFIRCGRPVLITGFAHFFGHFVQFQLPQQFSLADEVAIAAASSLSLTT
jgi:hypothetical protein